MLENVGLTYGALFSQRVLLAPVSGGMTRDDAYRVVQGSLSARDRDRPLNPSRDGRAADRRGAYEAWRRVEVGACEAISGPAEQELEAIRSATFTVDAVHERERVTDHDVAAFIDVLSESAAPTRAAGFTLA